MGHPPYYRLSWSALAEWLGARLAQLGDSGDAEIPAEMLGLAAGHDTRAAARRVVARWKHDGIPAYEADRIAVWFGTHPSRIWGWEYEQWRGQTWARPDDEEHPYDLDRTDPNDPAQDVPVGT